MDKDPIKNLGRTIRKLRKQQLITQMQFSFLTHLDTTYISAIEQDKANPTMKAIYKISKALKVKIHVLFKPIS